LRGPPLYFAYSVLLAVAFVLALPFYLWKQRRTGKYARSFRERMGRLPPGIVPGARPSVWVHAVSVGEVLTARPLLRALRARFPDRPLFLSVTTTTGHALALKDSGGADGVFFAPFDWVDPVRRALRATDPALLVLVETELWPNLVHEARRHGARVAVVNGRISDRAFARYRWVRGLLHNVLREVDVFLMQGEDYAGRIRELGAPPDRVRVLGSLKFDAVPDPRPPDALVRLLGGGAGPLIVAGSTVAGEEEHVLEALRQVRREVPEARLVMAPRHPERFGEAARLVAAAGFSCERRSVLPEGRAFTAEVLVLDTLGELASAYALATAVFVGGSLVPSGGHNVVEAAVAGKAVVVGPHMENFREIAEAFRREDALVQVAAARELGPALARLLTDVARRRQVGERARALVERNRGSVDRTVEALAVLVA
jgi:3-deoxy-D-manno-octulosonic-acid transferase